MQAWKERWRELVQRKEIHQKEKSEDQQATREIK